MNHLVTFTPEDYSAARKICALHNRQIPAIKEIRAKLYLGLREAKQLLDEVWNTVEHPLNVHYNGLDRTTIAPEIKYICLESLCLKLIRSDGETLSISLSKNTLKRLRDFGVPTN